MMIQTFKKYRFLLIASGLFSCFLLFPPFSQAEPDKDECVACHQKATPKIITDWEASVHKTGRISCSDCHGGDPKEPDVKKAKANEKHYRGKPKPQDIPDFCGTCHSDISRMKFFKLPTDILAEYKTSQHGLKLAQGNDKVANCVSCHGNHKIVKHTDPASSVYRRNLPETCAHCHNDPDRMGSIPTTPYDHYMKGVHGQIHAGKIPGKNPDLAPICSDCHGIHGAMPPGVKDVPSVCGNCHAKILSFYQQSVHADLGTPACSDCHENHNNQYPTLDLFTDPKNTHSCFACHDAQSDQIVFANKISQDITFLRQAIVDTQGFITLAKQAGQNTDTIREQLDSANTGLISLGPLTHSLHKEKFETSVKQVKDVLEKLKASETQLQSEIKQRKLGATVVAVVAIVFIFLIQLKRKEFPPSPL